MLIRTTEMKQRFVILLLMLASVLTARAQWTQTAGPEGGRLNSMAGNPHTILATNMYHDLFRYEGTKWNRIGELDTWDIMEHNGVFLASTTDRGLLRSTDDGDTWEPTGIDGRFMVLTSTLAQAYAAYQDTIFHTTDNGTSWDTLSTLPGHHIVALKTAGTTMLVGSMTMASSRMVNISFDDGASWVSREVDGPEEAYITSVEIMGDTLFAGFIQGGIYMSTDSGATWQENNKGLAHEGDGYHSINTMTRFGNSLWATSPSAVYRLGDTTWNVIAIEPNAILTAPSISWNSDILYRSTSVGVSKSRMPGNTWQSISTGLRLQVIDDMVLSGNGAILAATDAGIFRTSDAGASWDRTQIGDFTELARHGISIFARAGNTAPAALIRSTDHGVNWEHKAAGITEPLDMMNTLAASDFAIFTGFGEPVWEPGFWENGGIFRSTDNGESWQSAVNGLPTSDSIPVPVMALAASGTQVVAVTGAGVYYSNDIGNSWHASSLMDYESFLSMKIVGMGEEFVLSIGADLYYSDNGGATWQQQTLPIEEGQAYLISDISLIKGIPVVVTAGPGSQNDRTIQHVFRFNGEEWKDISGRFPEAPTYGSFVALGQTVFAGTFGASVWQAPAPWVVGEVAGVEQDENSATMVASRPNPFTTGTIIHLTMQNGGTARLVVTDAMGREVAILHDGYLAPGAHDFSFNGETLPAGTYFYRMVSETGNVTGTMVKVQ
jgi:photosystem II stability/assembly factor-like uncharacterized protein